MLLNLALWLGLASAALAIGTRLEAWLRPASPFVRPEDALLARIWLGLFALASALLALSLVTPIRPWMLAALGILFIRHLRQIPRAALWVALPAALSTAGPIRLFDTGLYHHPLIEWLNRYGTLAGMAGFYHRLGFSSSWFALNAATPVETAAGGFVFCLLLVHGCLATDRYRRGEAVAADRLWLGALPVLLAVDYWNHFHVSPSPNLPAAAAVVVVAWLFLLGQREMALACAGTAAAVKITLAPLVAASLVRHRRALLLAMFGAAPVLAANWVASGYVLFPATVLGSFGRPAWAVEESSAAYSSWETMVWARYGAQLHPGAVFWSLDWVPGWISRPSNALAVLVAAVGFVSVRGRLLAISLAGLGFWFASAPDVRLGFGYLALLAGSVPRLVAVRPAVILALVLLEAVLRPTVVSYMSPNAPLHFEISDLLRQPPLPQPAYRIRQAGNFRYTVPAGPACWDAPFPCTIDDPIAHYTHTTFQLDTFTPPPP